ncbi:MAG: Type 1 glutamine amidotransferase-like domain-containing protein [Thermoanaerobaculia bacterium]|nr:Type 1 glutamine amidotransferase-like domain-containing protein [Thermoanaerobaculia bacterium]
MITLLGPQRLQPILAEELARSNNQGPIAVVTAGWQEREAEVDELGEHVGCPVFNLLLHARAEDVFQSDLEFFAAYRQRQETLRSLQQLYRLRLGYVLGAVQDLLHREGDSALLDPEREAAISAAVELDRHHLDRVAQVHEEFEERLQPAGRSSIQKHRLEIELEIRRSEAFAVAGGHVAILLNRLRLFGIAPLVHEMPIFAWSAGAMVLGEQVVLFHDSPPQGQGFAEVLESGLGLYRGLIPLPHARHRLRLSDPVRVSLLARRFPGSQCLAMDEGSRIRLDGMQWSGARGRWLHPSGIVETVAA